jgi:exosortase/archaeosortase family protein
MKRGKKTFTLLDILVRYFILILLGLFGLPLLYLIFTPLTLYPVYFLLSLFYNAVLSGTSIIIREIPIELVKSCIAGAAYYLLLILNLTTPRIKIKKRLSMILFAFLVFLIVNILRIFFLAVLYLKGFSYFDLTHEIFWYFMSVIFVVLIWFAEIMIFKVKSVPFYSDLKDFYSVSILNKKRHNSKTSKKN